MANEWVKVELYGANESGDPRRYTIATGTSVSKGQTLALADNRTVVATTATQAACAGVASEEHLANSGTSISAWTNGLFRVLASGAISVGEGITFCENNQVRRAVIATASGAMEAGYALDTLAEDDIGTVRLRL